MQKWITSTKDPFKTLIITIISQHTNDKNTAKAFQNLSNKLRITPETLAKAETKQIEQCLKPAGLYHNKAREIGQVSRGILEKYNGDLTKILSMPLDDARKELLQFPGVGPKTADVVLLFCAEKPTMPIDTHVNRVSKRLGLASECADYETLRKALQSIFDPRDYLAVHVLLILHGRKYCRARAPLCGLCPLGNLCPSRHRFSQS
jgi:endonuclease-3